MSCWASTSAKKMVTQSVLVGSSPLGLAIDDEGNTALVACKDSGTVAIVDLKDFPRCSPTLKSEDSRIPSR